MTTAENDATTNSIVAPPPALTIRDEALVFDGLIVGEFDGTRLILNLGWCRLAGLSVRVEGDPIRDRSRRTILNREVDA